MNLWKSDIIFPIQESDSSEVLPDEAILDEEIEKVNKALDNPDASTSDKRKLRERKEDLMRLKRIEQIYVIISFFGVRNTNFTNLMPFIGWSSSSTIKLVSHYA